MRFPAAALALLCALSAIPSARAATLNVDDGWRWSGDFGLGAASAGTQDAAYVQTDTPDDETRLVVRFYFNASSPTFGLADPMTLFRALSGADVEIIRITISPDSPTPKITYSVKTDSATANTANIAVSPGWHFLEFDWTAATGAGADNGSLATKLDGVATAGLSNLDNDQSTISTLRWGIVSTGIAHTGTLRLDDFASRRSGPIGAALADSLDIDGDGVNEPLSDGLLLLRLLFGFTGTTLTSGAVSAQCDWCTADAILERKTPLLAVFDIDLDGTVQPLTDGLLALRYLFGFRDAALIAGAIGPGAQRPLADDIEIYIASLL